MRGAAIVGVALASVVGLLGYVRSTFRLVTVQGESMQPTLAAGQRLLVRRCVPRPGEIVVVVPPPGAVRDDDPTGRQLVKRVVAVPGSPVPRAGFPALADVPEHRVPAGRLVLAGDNPARSLDSRTLGYFAAANVVGVEVPRRRRSGRH